MRSLSLLSIASLIALAGCCGSGGDSDPVGPGGVTLGPPASIVVYSGNSQQGPKGSRLNDPLCTNVLDAAGHKLKGVVVTYTVTSGGGQLAEPSTPATDAGGIATSGLWTLGPTAGPQYVTATSPGAGSVTFLATAQ